MPGPALPFILGSAIANAGRSAALYLGKEAFQEITGSYIAEWDFDRKLARIEARLPPPFQIPFNDLSHQKLYNKAVNRNRTMIPRQGANLIERRNFAPDGLELPLLIQGFNQGPWPSLNEAGRLEMWRNLSYSLAAKGVFLPAPDKGDAINAELSSNEPKGVAWYRHINMSGAAASLDDVIRNYWRSSWLPVADKTIDQPNLNFALQRAEFRRAADRKVLLEGFRDWSYEEIARLFWLGLLSSDEFHALRKSAGYVQERDYHFADYLMQKIPDPQRLIGWSGRALWDHELAARYGMDDGLNAPAQFYARAQGYGALTHLHLPGEPADNDRDWVRLSYREARSMPDFGLASLMQHRLRPDPAVAGRAVNGQGQPWTEANTRDMLKLAGYPSQVAERMLALVHAPLSIRFINHLLTPTIEHADFAELVGLVLGPTQTWVENTMLDQGYEPAMAKLIAQGLIIQANDHHLAERKAHEKRQRDETREQAKLEYEAGTITQVEAQNAMLDEFFTPDMAAKEIALIDSKRKLKIDQVKISALHEAYEQGKTTVQEIVQWFNQFGITGARQSQYLELWQWERSEKVRTLATAQVVSALKAGLLTPEVATARLVNLGWQQGEAILEIAVAEKEIATALAKSQATAASHAQAAAAKLAHEHAAQAAKERAEAIKAGKEKDKLDLAEALAVHKDLMDRSAYFKSVHLQNAAYKKAQDKGDQEKMDALIQAEIVAYQKWLVQQIELVHSLKGAPNAPTKIDTQPAPGIIESQGVASAQGESSGESQGPAS